MEDNTIWLEKYRPNKLDAISGQRRIIKRLKSYIASKNLPHLLFSGPPGVGKTAAALCIARELYGEKWQNNFMELNASDERGIDVVRNKIKTFARIKSLGKVKFKIIFLDEVDSMTSDAMSALRRTMELYTSSCRFILSCNYSSKIIEPIQSRCAVYRFKPLSKEEIATRIRYICKRENITLMKSGLEAITYVADGDMRRAITALQSGSIISSKVNAKAIYTTSSYAKPEEIIKLLRYSLDGNFLDTRKQLHYLTINKGISADDIIQQIYKTVVDMNIPDKIKLKILYRLGETDFHISEGANETIQLESFLAYVMLKGSKIKR